MKRALQALAVLLVVLATANCSGKSQPYVELPHLTDDLIGVWRGYYDTLEVPGSNTSAAIDLVDARTAIILQQETYWFEITSFTDTLEYSFVSQGYWNWFESAPDVIVFEMTQERERITRKRPPSGGGGQGGGGGADTSAAQGDSIISEVIATKGDGSEILESWIAIFEFAGEDTLQVSEISGDLTLPGITLERN